MYTCVLGVWEFGVMFMIRMWNGREDREDRDRLHGSRSMACRLRGFDGFR